MIIAIVVGTSAVLFLSVLLIYLNRNDINVEPPRPRWIWRRWRARQDNSNPRSRKGSRDN